MNARLRTSAAFLAGFMAFGAFGPPPTAATPRRPGPLVVRLRPGALVEAGGLSAVVPPPGHTVLAEALMVEGPSRALAVESRPDGTVSVYEGPAIEAFRRGAAPGSGSPTPSDAPSECDDSAYSLYSSKWTSTYRWYYKKSSSPNEVGNDDSESAVKRGVGNITGGDNNCGLPDKVGIAYSYQGTTSTSANITTLGGCSSGDGKNVADFGTLPTTMLALSCWWISGGTTTQGDLRLNKASFLWVVDLSGCSNKFSVEAVSTHEFGHIFGLAHVSEASHPNLTMSPSIAACQSSESTLGLGDVRGLEAKY